MNELTKMAMLQDMAEFSQQIMELQKAPGIIKMAYEREQRGSSKLPGLLAGAGLGAGGVKLYQHMKDVKAQNMLRELASASSAVPSSRLGRLAGAAKRIATPRNLALGAGGLTAAAGAAGIGGLGLIAAINEFGPNVNTTLSDSTIDLGNKIRSGMNTKNLSYADLEKFLSTPQGVKTLRNKWMSSQSPDTVSNLLGDFYAAATASPEARESIVDRLLNRQGRSNSTNPEYLSRLNTVNKHNLGTLPKQYGDAVKADQAAMQWSKAQKLKKKTLVAEGAVRNFLRKLRGAR